MPSDVAPVAKNPLRHLIGTLLSQWKFNGAKRAILAGGTPGEAGFIQRSDWPQSVVDPTAFYGRCYRYFHQRFDPALKAHREYFTREGRGFGEDAFHVMWKTIFDEIQPRNFLEIGVFRGQTLSLIALLAQQASVSCEVVGISPFDGGGDSTFHYATDLDYMADVKENFAHFGLSAPSLEKLYSTDPAARRVLESRAWDLIYIDGSHDYPVVRSDWALCSQHVRVGGLIVMDDAGSDTSYRPPVFSTKGSPEVARAIGEIDRERFRPVLQVGHNVAFERRA